EKWRITANRLETRRVACACDSGLPNLVNRADTSSSTMCCGFRFKDSNREAREECARSRRQSRERPRTRSIGSFIPMKRSARTRASGLREPWWLGAGAATKRKPRPSAAWAGHPVESRCSVGSATRRRFFLTVALSELARDLSIKTQTVREVFNRPTIGEGYN